MDHLLSLVDGGWFDIVTFVVAVGQTGRDILHGIAIFPLFMLMVSVFSNEALQSLL